MITKLVIVSSAVLMGICGIVLQFFPHEILNYFNVEAAGILPLFVQIIGALYLGFAMMNWMAKSVLIGGIYARPLAMGNFMHAIVGTLALLKYAYESPNFLGIWIPAIVYSIFAILFGFVVFGHPLKSNDSNEK